MVVLLADTNIWLAAADRRSDRHGECAAILREHRGGLAAPVPVIAEASWLILDRLGTAAQAAFLRLITSGQLAPVDLTSEDWQRCDGLAEQYASLKLDLIDASLIAVAERLGHTRLATLNHRDFTVVRPRLHPPARLILPATRPWIFRRFFRQPHPAAARLGDMHPARRRLASQPLS